ncbi:hypothetical protein [Streptomyces sp. NBC_01264]|uniref:hypothetical protein n=1 Tax=Streptomyces sp. NBC_01264 TaxID=2903804 RepID=UPI0022545E87|nr:hypothetical protein [Streptomyces sp. NBC_01264]MCX4776515.1 hypothetical protein [Streptomyces sp. NBC_01264]
MKTWSQSPFPPTVPLSGVPEGATVSTENGESRLVHEIDGRPGWLAKLYKSPPKSAQAEALDTLVSMPGLMSPADRDLVDRCVSWPVSRITDGGEVVGVVMAKAPERFYARLRTPWGVHEPAPLVLDWLVQDPEACRKRGITPASTQVRLRTMHQLLSVAALFARHDVVYADWSYRNAFWDEDTGDAFVIDMDTCGIGTRDWVESPKWEDPLFAAPGRPLTPYSDRYKIAMLTVRCLTGVRDDPLVAHAQLVRTIGVNPFTSALEQALTSAHETGRPSPEQLMHALLLSVPERPSSADTAPAGRAPSSNVTGEIKVGPAAYRRTDASPTAPTPSGATAAGPTATGATAGRPPRPGSYRPPATRPRKHRARAVTGWLLALLGIAYCVTHFGYGLV